MFIFLKENNTELPPVLFHQRFPFHTLKVTDICVNFNRMQCKKTKKMNVILSDEKEKNNLLIEIYLGLESCGI